MSELETGALGPGRIESRELEQEMRSSFLGYAMHVIVSRALPDVRDGLKPVHRRVLYSMWTNGNRPGRPYVKCANIVGYVMGKAGVTLSDVSYTRPRQVACVVYNGVPATTCPTP